MGLVDGRAADKAEDLISRATSELGFGVWRGEGGGVYSD